MPKKQLAPATNAYRAHRERQRRRILDAAKALIDGRGIDRVTMADLTATSGVQPSTMYQYFANKDDIIWALVAEEMERGAKKATQKLEAAPDALAEITALLDHLRDQLLNNPDNVRFMAQFDAMYARDWPAERLLAVESQIAPEGFGFLTKLVRRGIAEGSLRSDLDPELTMHAVLNAMVGTQRRLASLGSKVEAEYGHTVDRLFGETVRIILLGLRAPEPSSRRKPDLKPKIQKRISRRRSS
jgi:AcrR family transcriptional regulator